MYCSFSGSCVWVCCVCMCERFLQHLFRPGSCFVFVLLHVISVVAAATTSTDMHMCVWVCGLLSARQLCILCKSLLHLEPSARQQQQQHHQHQHLMHNFCICYNFKWILPYSFIFCQGIRYVYVYVSLRFGVDYLALALAAHALDKYLLDLVFILFILRLPFFPSLHFVLFFGRR